MSDCPRPLGCRDPQDCSCGAWGDEPVLASHSAPSIFPQEFIDRAEAAREEALADLTPEGRAIFERAEQRMIDLMLFGVAFETSDGERIDPLDIEPGMP